MSQAQDRHISVNDLAKVGFTAVCFNSDDLAKLPPRIQNEVRQAKIEALEANERPLDQIEFGDRHPFGRREYEELKKLRAEHQAAGQTVDKPATPAATPAADGNNFAPGGVPYQQGSTQ